MSQQLLFVDGHWREGSDGTVRPLVNPAAESAIGTVACATPADIQAAIRTAQHALESWRQTPVEQRAEILGYAAELLDAEAGRESPAFTLEQGKTLREARFEFQRAVETLRWHAASGADVLANRILPSDTFARHLQADPIGIVAAFVPWNYPAVLTARKLAAALIAGCTVVMKGAEEAPSPSVAVVRALDKAGLPPGVVNLVFGDPPAISQQLLTSPAVRAITFTGSSVVGKSLAAIAGRALMRGVFELGGHSPVIVCQDADIKDAARAVVEYKFECAGQSCNAPSRIYVHEDVAAEFTQQALHLVSQIVVGDGLDERTTMGPLANARRLAAVNRLTRDAIDRGATVLTGGSRLERPGYFWPPTVLSGIADASLLLQEEPFGPLLPIMTYRREEDAVRKANANPYGLAAYAFTNSAEAAKRLVNALDAGAVRINHLGGVPPDAGVGGVKDSGVGYEGGPEGILSFVQWKYVAGLSL
jgi:succinate-semialdehyde dehydrogenase/glutarate-semialdehyde dehydrogenase